MSCGASVTSVTSSEASADEYCVDDDVSLFPVVDDHEYLSSSLLNVFEMGLLTGKQGTCA